MRHCARLLVVPVLCLLLLAGLAAPAHAEVISRGKHCVGEQRLRCGWMNVDYTNHRIRGYASIYSNLEYVVISHLTLYRSTTSETGPWTLMLDSWFSTDDFILLQDEKHNLGLVTCTGYYWYRVTYDWQVWNIEGAPSGSGSDASYTIRTRC